MNATLLYRIAAVLLLLFAIGHTFGFLGLKPPSPEGLAVRDAMNNVLIQLKGTTFTYGNFYKGFGLTVTAYLLFAAFLAWHLGGVASSQPQSIGMLGWAFVAVQVACLVLSVIYFFLLPALFSGAVVICLAWAAWLVQRGAA
jgi:hypothetical protein